MFQVQEIRVVKKKSKPTQNSNKSLNPRLTFGIAQAGENSCVDYLVSWVLVFFFIGPKNIWRLKLELQLINIYQWIFCSQLSFSTESPENKMFIILLAATAQSALMDLTGCNVLDISVSLFVLQSSCCVWMPDAVCWHLTAWMWLL